MAMVEVTEMALFDHTTKRRTEALALQIWRKIAMKIRLFKPMEPPMATVKGASQILWIERGYRDRQGRHDDICVWNFNGVSYCIWGMANKGNICAISGTWHGIFWEDGVSVYFIHGRDHMETAFGLMYAV
jgi:hypothetical protein